MHVVGVHGQSLAEVHVAMFWPEESLSISIFTVIVNYDVIMYYHV